MDEHVQSFLADIVAHPHDDAPRLIFADWIEDHAGALPPDVRDRGQLIRVQYALEGLGDDDPRRPMLQTRAAALIHAHRAAWTAGFNQYLHVPAFRRGFVEGISLSFHGPPLERPEALAPLRQLKLAHADTHSLPVLAQVEDLDLSESPFPSAARAAGWLAAADLPRIASLTTQGESTAGVLRSPLLERLQSLTVVGAAVLGGEVRPTPRLERLSLSRPPAGTLTPLLDRLGGSVRHLVVSEWRMPSRPRPPFGLPLASRLQHLDLSHGRLDLAALTREPCARLERLTLKTCLFADDPWPHLNEVNFPALRALNLRNLRHAAGLERFAESPLFARLESLHLGYSRLGPHAVLALGGYLPAGLRTLDLSWNPIGDAAALGVASSAAAATLEALDLSYCGLRWFTPPAEAPLIALNLGINRLDDGDVRALLDSPAAQKLEALDVSNNRLTDDAVPALLAWPRLRDVSLLSLHGNALSPAALERVRGGFRGLLL